MVLKSYAKINLTLSVNKRLKCGLHNIQSIYCLIDLHDKMFLKKFKKSLEDGLKFKGDIHFRDIKDVPGIFKLEADKDVNNNLIKKFSASKLIDDLI